MASKPNTELRYSCTYQTNGAPSRQRRHRLDVPYGVDLKRPEPPPVYRPANASARSARDVSKLATVQRSPAAGPAAPPPYRPPSTGVQAPPVYRPNQRIQPRISTAPPAPPAYLPPPPSTKAPSVYRPGHTGQPKQASAQLAPPVFRPAGAKTAAPFQTSLPLPPRPLPITSARPGILQCTPEDAWKKLRSFKRPTVDIEKKDFNRAWVLAFVKNTDNSKARRKALRTAWNKELNRLHTDFIHLPDDLVPQNKRKFHQTVNPHVEGATGNTGSGYKLKGQDVVKRAKRDYAPSRLEQVLGQISTQCYFMLRNEGSSEQEVEAMKAGASLFLSANSTTGTQEILDHLSFTNLTTTYTFGTSKDKELSKRHSGKLTALSSGDRDIPEAKGTLDLTSTKAVAIYLNAGNAAEEARKALITPGTYVVFGADQRHAEVKLVQLLMIAGHTGGATIQGKKRPCYTCAAFMRLRNQAGFNIRFSDNPGKLWQDEWDRSETDVQDEVARAVAAKESMFASESGEKYRSPSVSPCNSPLHTTDYI